MFALAARRLRSVVDAFVMTGIRKEISSKRTPSCVTGPRRRLIRSHPHRKMRFFRSVIFDSSITFELCVFVVIHLHLNQIIMYLRSPTCRKFTFSITNSLMMHRYVIFTTIGISTELSCREKRRRKSTKLQFNN